MSLEAAKSSPWLNQPVQHAHCQCRLHVIDEGAKLGQHLGEAQAAASERLGRENAELKAERDILKKCRSLTEPL